MKLTKEEREQFLEKKKVLNSCIINLKQEFIGLDDIIDDIILMIEPWYLFPDAQLRPLVINLFGMTGVGKTSLVNRMFFHLGISDKLYKFDIGEHASDKSYSDLSHVFSETLSNSTGEPIAVIFDEFQLGRTIDANGGEVDRSNLRIIWELLDTGKVQTLQNGWYTSSILNLYFKLKECVNNKVEVSSGKVTKNKEFFQKMFDIETEEEEESDKEVESNTTSESGNNSNEKKVSIYEDDFIRHRFYYYIKEAWKRRFLSDSQLKEYLNKLDHNQIVDFIKNTLSKTFVPVECDYSKSAVFVIGNIDEAYIMSSVIDPDADADRFHEHSKKITIPEIKDALHKRYRSEQIARLGNNHIIYPAFSSKNYKDIIKLELEKIRKKCKEKFNIELTFEKSLRDIIYCEGVFPTQGARPVFTTINYLVENYIVNIIKDIIDSDNDNIKYVRWAFKKEKFHVSFFEEIDGAEIFSKKYNVKLKIDNLRKTKKDELQSMVAVHEAGHAVVFANLFNKSPEIIVSKTASPDAGGYCSIKYPDIDSRKSYEDRLSVLLAGRAAEEIVFSEDNITPGAYSDLEKATNLSLSMFKLYAMGNVNSLISNRSRDVSNTYVSDETSLKEAEQEAVKICNECIDRARKILESERLLFLKVSEYLSLHSRMSKKIFIEYYNKYSANKSVDFNKEKPYFSYKNALKQKLDKK